MHHTRTPLIGSKTVFLLLSLLLSPVLLAHTSLIASLPADKQALPQSPRSLQLSFGDPVRLMRLTLTDEQGDKIAVNYRPSARPRTEYSHPLQQDLVPGSYRLEWSAMASDGHNMSGEISFAILSSAHEPSANKGSEPSAQQEPSAEEPIKSNK